MRRLIDSIERTVLFPGSATQGLTEANVRLSADDMLERVPTSLAGTIAVAVRPAVGAPESGVLFCYGNAMCLASAIDELEWFSGEGRRVVAIPEYAGYGVSDGQASEAGCYASAQAALKVLQDRFALPPDRIVLAGWSLGAAVALELATHIAPAGLMLFSPFTSISGMVRAISPRWIRPLTARIASLGTARFDSLSRISLVRCPVLIVHGRQDELVPFAMGQALAEALGTAQAHLIPLPSAGHNDLFVVGGEPLREACDTFCDRCLNSAPSGF